MPTIRCRDLNGNLTEPIPLDQIVERISVYGIIINDEHVLLVPQWDGYDFPGGGKEPGEMLRDTLIREVKEETGLDVEQGPTISATDDYFVHPLREEYWHSVLIYYTAHITGGELSDAGLAEFEKEYAGKAQWIPLERVPELKFYNPSDNVSLIETARQTKQNIVL